MANTEIPLWYQTLRRQRQIFIVAELKTETILESPFSVGHDDSVEDHQYERSPQHADVLRNVIIDVSLPGHHYPAACRARTSFSCQKRFTWNMYFKVK